MDRNHMKVISDRITVIVKYCHLNETSIPRKLLYKCSYNTTCHIILITLAHYIHICGKKYGGVKNFHYYFS